jgi:hypothetical protein
MVGGRGEFQPVRAVRIVRMRRVRLDGMQHRFFVLVLTRLVAGGYLRPVRAGEYATFGRKRKQVWSCGFRFP